jgi:hypothetical protein
VLCLVKTRCLVILWSYIIKITSNNINLSIFHSFFEKQVEKELQLDFENFQSAMDSPYCKTHCHSNDRKFVKFDPKKS